MDRDKSPAETHPRAGRSAAARLRDYFLTGVLVAGPIAITVWLTLWLIDLVDSRVKPLVPQSWNPDTYLPFAVPGFGVLVALFALTMLGFLTANFIGRALWSAGENLLQRTPFVRPIYNTAKQIFATIISDREANYKQVALIEFPRKGLRTIAFIAGPAPAAVAREMGRRPGEILTVFVPTTPNPTGGYLLFLPREEVLVIDFKPEDAAKLVLSGGLVLPEGRADARPVMAPPAVAAK